MSGNLPKGPGLGPPLIRVSVTCGDLACLPSANAHLWALACHREQKARSKRSGQSLGLPWGLHSWTVSPTCWWSSCWPSSGSLPHLWCQSYLLLAASASLSSSSWCLEAQLETWGTRPPACLTSDAHLIPGCGPDPFQAAPPHGGPGTCSGKISTNDPIKSTNTASQAPENQDTGPCTGTKCRPWGAPETMEKGRSSSTSRCGVRGGRSYCPCHSPIED